MVRLAYVVSHPIQYQAPLLRRIAREPDIDLTVLFGSDFSIRGYKDQGFGVEVTWDVPLLNGYRSEFLPRLRDNGTVSPLSPISRGILRRLSHPDGSPRHRHPRPPPRRVLARRPPPQPLNAPLETALPPPASPSHRRHASHRL